MCERTGFTSRVGSTDSRSEELKMASSVEEPPCSNVVEELKKEAGLYWCEDMFLLKYNDPLQLDRIKSFKFAENDVLLSTYPRSGTHWSQEITWLICNNADTDTAKKIHLEKRSPFIDFTREGVPTVELLENTPPPRVIKTHFPPQIFEHGLNGPKVIIVMRNLKDVMVSHFHFYQQLFNFKGSWDDFFEMFKQDEMFYGSWVKHCLKCWKLRDVPNVLMLKYEDMKRNPAENIKKIADFCGKELSEDQISKIADYTQVHNMKKKYDARPDYGKVIRKGVVGDWKGWFTENQLKYVDDLLKATTEAQGLFFSDKV